MVIAVVRFVIITVAAFAYINAVFYVGGGIGIRDIFIDFKVFTISI